MFTNQSKQRALISIIDKNKVGMVNDLTNYLSENQANVESINATRLGDFFGVYCQFSADAHSMRMIENSYEMKLESMSPVLKQLSHLSNELGDSDSPNYTLQVYAFDAKGIVSETTALLRKHNVDIVDLAGCSFNVPFSGTLMLLVEMEILVSTDLEALHRGLERLRAKMGWELSLEQRAVEPTPSVAESSQDSNMRVVHS